MARDYFKLLQSLLPRGKAWNRDPDSVLSQLLEAEGDELLRVDERGEDLFLERDTRTANELLSEHETDLGLPDECTESDATIQERRNLAHSKLIARGQQDKGYFIALAEALGYTINIIEYTPFWSGFGESGDPCGAQANIFHWTVETIGGAEEIIFTSGASQSGDPLRKVPGLEALTCLISKYKPAHTVVEFVFVGPEFGAGFDRSFDSIPSDDPTFLLGAFHRGFSSAFDVYYAGAFDFGAFNNEFDKPA